MKKVLGNYSIEEEITKKSSTEGIDFASVPFRRTESQKESNGSRKKEKRAEKKKGSIGAKRK